MLDVKELLIKISKKEIVHGISFDVADKDFVGIIGPNGSGKSTTLKAIYRVLKPVSGAIFIDGLNITEVSMKESALKTAVVAQHNYYNFDFSVMDVAMMGRAPHKEPMELDNEHDREIARDALSKVGMLEFADRNFYTLSGGEQQRVILARALTQQTPFLILDEPTNHLDIKYQLQLMDTIKDLDGLTVLCALHDLNIACEYCNKLIMMKDGSVYAVGTPEEILTPENIKEVYGVNATVERHPVTGLLNIVYHPNFTKGRNAPVAGPVE